MATESQATEEPAATEDADVVVIIEAEEPVSPLPTTDKDWFSLRQLVELIGFIVVVVVGVFRGGSILEGAAKLFGRVSNSQLINDEAMRQYQRLSPDKQAKIATLIDVVDPLTKTTASHLDDDFILWFRKITTPPVS